MLHTELHRKGNHYQASAYKPYCIGYSGLNLFFMFFRARGTVDQVFFFFFLWKGREVGKDMLQGSHGTGLKPGTATLRTEASRHGVPALTPQQWFKPDLLLFIELLLNTAHGISAKSLSTCVCQTSFYCLCCLTPVVPLLVFTNWGFTPFSCELLFSIKN